MGEGICLPMLSKLHCPIVAKPIRIVELVSRPFEHAS